MHIAAPSKCASIPVFLRRHAAAAAACAAQLAIAAGLAVAAGLANAVADAA